MALGHFSRHTLLTLGPHHRATAGKPLSFALPAGVQTHGLASGVPGLEGLCPALQGVLFAVRDPAVCTHNGIAVRQAQPSVPCTASRALYPQA